ncbi:er-associated protein catabolism-related protein [Phaffia rhodozyma]|uniref:Nuclear protein localization protein 4 n=1 Tax=Phaffia rhodozyma TaxID=264483 RepID=A0A0F7SKX8_PHARH|nr:er-associated protein catabolism-related protein [Phaffia rhodozyma]
MDSLTIRLRSKEGTSRIVVAKTTSGQDLAQKIIDSVPDDVDSSSITISNQPGSSGERLSLDALTGRSVSDMGFQNGELLFLEYKIGEAPLKKASVLAPTHTAATLASGFISTPLADVPTDPISTVFNANRVDLSKVDEAEVDKYYRSLHGMIPRSRDNKMCRHGDKGMCDYCTPLEPYDANYHAEHKIKHLSFPAYVRKITGSVSASQTSTSSTSLPPLDPLDYKVTIPCPSGSHPSWPSGICSKCQPSAITLQSQPFRLVDHVEFATPSLVDRFLEGWRRSGQQRLGWLIGKYEPYENVPMGVKAVVEAVCEPIQESEVDGVSVDVPWDEEKSVQELAGWCAKGLEVVGVLYSDLTPSPDDITKVLYKRHPQSYYLSSLELLFSARLQSAHPLSTRLSPIGRFGSRFVTCVLTGTEEGGVDVMAFQASEQAVAMLEADMIEASVDPGIVRVKREGEKRYVPDVFYTFKNEYKLQVKQSAKPCFPVEYLLVNLTHGFPVSPAPLFPSFKFPVSNRLLSSSVEQPSMSQVIKGLLPILGDGSALDFKSEEVERWAGDWELLRFLQKEGGFNQEEMKLLCRVATGHSRPEGEFDALMELAQTDGWRNLMSIVEAAAEAQQQQRLQQQQQPQTGSDSMDMDGFEIPPDLDDPFSSGGGGGGSASVRTSKVMSESPLSPSRTYQDGSDEDGPSKSSGGQRTKTALNRTSRACNNCRKQKMRCIGAEDPPCKRCKNAGLSCLFEKPAKDGPQVGEERIKHLESQVTSIQSTLTELVSTLKATAGLQAPPSTSLTEPQRTSTYPPPPSAPYSGDYYPHSHPHPHPHPHPSNALRSPHHGSTSYDPSGYPAKYSSSNYPPDTFNSSGYQNQSGSARGDVESSFTDGRASSSYASSGLDQLSNALLMSNTLQAPGSSSLQPPGETNRRSSRPGGLADHTSSSSQSLRNLSNTPLSILPNHPYPLPNRLPWLDTFGSQRTTGSTSGNGAGNASGGGNSSLSSTNTSNQQETSSSISPSVSDKLNNRASSTLRRTTSGLDQPHFYPSLPQTSASTSTSNPSPATTSSSHLSSYPHPNHHGLFAPQISSARTSPAGSEADENELELEMELPSSALTNPLGAMGDLAQAAGGQIDQAVVSVRQEETEEDGGGISALMLLAGAGSEARPSKRARFQDNPKEEQSHEKKEKLNTDTGGKRTSTSGASRGGAGTGRIKSERGLGAAGNKPDEENGGIKNTALEEGPGMRGSIGGPPVGPNGVILDCVDAGLVGDEEARTLFELFWSGAHQFLPIYEPGRDTFDELKRRSPFSISVMCFTGARIRDGGRPRSELQTNLWYHVRKISQETLFKSRTRVEAVQATILMAGFNEYGWLLAGHAVRLAFEIGCHSAFLKLVRSGMGAGKTPLQLEEDRPLVIMSRLWFCLYLIEHQMSYGTGRPPIVREDETILRCKEFLSHPLAVDTDWRLIASVEIMKIRAPLHLQLYNLPEDVAVGTDTLEKLQQANLDFNTWFDEWDARIAEKFGPEREAFFRQSLKSLVGLSVIGTALRKIHNPADVQKMHPAQRELALLALRNAQQCIDICLHAEAYRASLPFAVHYTHISAAFAATLLIRLARIFPTELDLRQTARDVEQLAKLLASVPAGRYARSIRLTLRSARRRKVMPPPSALPSPTSRSTPLPSVAKNTTATTPLSSENFTNVNQTYAQSTMLQSGLGSPVEEYPVEVSQTFDAPTTTSSIEFESPPDYSVDFDWSYTEDLMGKMGLNMTEGGQVPLWLHGSDIGSSQLPSAGMENFFLPSDLDVRLLHTSFGSQSSAAGEPTQEDSFGEIW